MLFIPSGSTTLNLALSDNPFNGFQTGKIANLIGDSSSGKTVLALTTLAEAAHDKRFDEYDLIYRDVEAALSIDLENLFSERLVERLEYDPEKEVVLDTIEDFYGDIVNIIDRNKPFIYVLDSFDALTSKDELKRSHEYGKIMEDDSDKEVKGSFKADKPKLFSEILRVIKRGVKQTNSFVIIISQTRDNLGFGAMFTPRVRSGGKALKFYSTYEIWLAAEGREKTKGRYIGSNVCAKIEKNKITGKRRDAYFPIWYDYGVDDIQSCINFLIDEKHWQKDGRKIIAPEFELDLTFDKVVAYIEDNKEQQKLKEIVGKVWMDIEESLKLKRVKKFL